MPWPKKAFGSYKRARLRVNELTAGMALFELVFIEGLGADVGAAGLPWQARCRRHDPLHPRLHHPRLEHGRMGLQRFPADARQQSGKLSVICNLLVYSRLSKIG